MTALQPSTPAELAEALANAARKRAPIELRGAATKLRIGGPIARPDTVIETTGLRKLLQYEPNDLTVSVEAGMPWRELTELLAANRQMIPLDPPFAGRATVGGVIAANLCGPRRRAYGSVRDAVIGMQFATLEGKLIQSGGLVVKNVAGLDMGKLMIGSLGTLAAVALVNFKVTPAPLSSRTFLSEYAEAAPAIAGRDRVLRSQLQPVAIDVLNPAAAQHAGRSGWVLAIRVAGSERVVERYAREFPGSAALAGEAETNFWLRIQDWIPAFLDSHAEGAIVRVSTTLAGVAETAGSTAAPMLVRAGTGVAYAGFGDVAAGVEWLRGRAAAGARGVVEFRPSSTIAFEQWPSPGDDLATMRQIKTMLDPDGVLNPGRLYGRI